MTVNKYNERHADLMSAFCSSLNIKGRPFDQKSSPIFGVSDGNEGVQWNLEIKKDCGDAYLGINLEGMKYHEWPIKSLILSELNRPTLHEIKSQLESHDDIVVRFSRDAWQVNARPLIKEQLIGGEVFSLSDLDEKKWLSILTEAPDCLNRDGAYRGRAKQIVTLLSGDKKELEVSPHITILSKLNKSKDIQVDIKRKIEELTPLYTWMLTLTNKN